MIKKLLFLSLLLISLRVSAQTYFPTAPTGSTSFTPTYRFTGSITDSLGMNLFISNGGKFWQVYTSTQANKRFGTPIFNNGIGSYGSYIGLGNNPLQQNTFVNINNHSLTFIDSANNSNFFRFRNSDGITGIWDDGSEGVSVNFNPGAIDLIAALDDNTGRSEFIGTTDHTSTLFINQGTGLASSITADATGVSFLNTFTYKLPHVDPSLDIVDGGSLLTKHKADSLYSAFGSSINIYNTNGTTTGPRTVSIGSNNFLITDGNYVGISAVPGNNVQITGGSSSTAYGQIGVSATQSAISYNYPTFGGVASGLSFNPTAITFTDPLGHGPLGASDYSAYSNPLAYAQQKFVTNAIAGLGSTYEVLSNKVVVLNNSDTNYPSTSAVYNAIAQQSTQTLIATPSSGSAVYTSTPLQNVNIIDVSRGGLIYYPTSAAPTGNSFTANITAGSITFQDNFNGAEQIQVHYKATSITVDGQPYGFVTYATNSAITYPFTTNTIIHVVADETKGSHSFYYFAPSGTSAKQQLAPIAVAYKNYGN